MTDILPTSLVDQFEANASLPLPEYAWEVWEDVLGWNGLYQVSSFGRVKSLERTVARSNGRSQLVNERILKPSTQFLGYQIVCLIRNGKPTSHYVHRLVATAFLPTKNGCTQVNHKDFNPRNNSLSNLEWCSPKQNISHTRKSGRSVDVRGEKCGTHILSEDQVKEIRRKYVPYKIGYAKLSKEYGVAHTTIRAIISRQTWKHL